MSNKYYKVKDLFGNEEIHIEDNLGHMSKKSATYEEFTDKFKPKLTTDDCYTPEEVYATVLDYARKAYSIPDDAEVIRPFYPGGDFENCHYPDGCVVIDNPPFSIISRICRWYIGKGIKFFLLAPHLTLFGIKVHGISYIVTDSAITYANGAVVKTDFVTNIPEEPVVMASYELHTKLADLRKRKKKIKYEYPKNVITVSKLGQIIVNGSSACYPISKTRLISRLQSQRASGKGIFGSGLLVADDIAEDVDKKIAEDVDKKIAEDVVIKWPLSDEEKKIINQL